MTPTVRVEPSSRFGRREARPPPVSREPMVILKAERLQRLALQLARLERSLEAEGGELHELRGGLEAAAAAVGVDLATARRLDVTTLAEALAPGEAPASGRLWVAAEVLFLDALLARAEGRDETARRGLARARHLYREVGSGLELPEEAPLPGERLRRIDELLGKP